jgi:hypothetical protein
MRRALLIALTGAALVAPAAVARSAAFTGNACTLLNARQVAVVHVPSKCSHNTTTGSASTLNYGTWGTATGPHVSVTVDSFTSTGSAFQLSKKYLGQIPNAKKLSGIGNAAWASTQGTTTSINFVVGHTTCQLGVVTAKPLTSLAPAIALAKAVAAKL